MFCFCQRSLPAYARVKQSRVPNAYDKTALRLEVGDIVAVKNKETFPCDLLVLSTSSLAGKCYVMTANLDGETNLKPKLAVRQTRKYLNVGLLKSLTGQIECQNPNPDLFSFSGLIQLERELGTETHPINLENLGVTGGHDYH